MKFNSIKFKISVLYIIILGAILIAYSGILYLSLRYTLYNELDNELNKKAEEIARAIDSYVDVLGRDDDAFSFAASRAITLQGRHPQDEKIKELENLWLQKVDKLDLKEDYVDLLDMQGNSLIRPNNLKGVVFLISAREIEQLKAGKPVFKSIKIDKRNLRAISTPFSYGANEQYIIQVGASLKPLIHLLQLRLTHIAISIPLILLLASFIGRIFVFRILRPVVEITKTASEITHEDLSSRVKAGHVDEEMRYLVDAFNDMISRLERSFKYIAEFSSHVAHDLKTPLAIIKGESDIALRKNRSIDEYKRVISGNVEEAERMLKVIDNLLLLTRLEYKPELFKFERLELIEFLREICEQGRILAAQKDIEVGIVLPRENQIFIFADKLHLRRMFFNLIDNAIKFTPPKGKVDMGVKRQEKKVAVSISDTGIGIAADDLPKIFDKYFYVENESRQSSSGAGLGLSIAQSIVKIHHGSIEVAGALGKGAVFLVILPLA